jgi:hypothetical protein
MEHLLSEGHGPAPSWDPLAASPITVHQLLAVRDAEKLSAVESSVLTGEAPRRRTKCNRDPRSHRSTSLYRAELNSRKAAEPPPDVRPKDLRYIWRGAGRRDLARPHGKGAGNHRPRGTGRGRAAGARGRRGRGRPPSRRLGRAKPREGAGLDLRRTPARA